MKTNPDPYRWYEGCLRGDKKGVTISAPAKINLFLKVLGKRPDGYHSIYSWFQAVDLADLLEITADDSGKIVLECDRPELPVGPDNLVYKAAQSVQEILPEKTGFAVRLHKRIPIGAGLGGGSSDAAAFIKGINKLLGLGLSRARMSEIGLTLGSDVPFFFGRGQAEVTGRGEEVSDIYLPLDYSILLVTPSFEVSAAEAYRQVKIDLTDSISSISIKYGHISDMFAQVSRVPNDLERAITGSYPEITSIREKLRETGADIVRMSGSGPTMFALYCDKDKAKKQLAASFEGEKWGVVVASPVVLPA